MVPDSTVRISFGTATTKKCLLVDVDVISGRGSFLKMPSLSDMKKILGCLACVTIFVVCTKGHKIHVYSRRALWDEGEQPLGVLALPGRVN